jgi:hypothetical protein
LYNKNKTTLIQYPAGKTGASFTIPNSVTSIGGLAFDGCESLTSVTFQGTITSSNFGGKAFFPWLPKELIFDSFEVPFDGDLSAKFYATNRTNGTPGTYTRPNGESKTWTKQ